MGPAAECAEHIALSEDLISGMGKSTLTKPAETDKVVRGDAARADDQKLLDVVVDRSHKAQAPEPLKPNHKFSTPEEAVEHFRKSRTERARELGLSGHHAPELLPRRSCSLS